MPNTTFAFNRTSFTSDSPSWSGPGEEYSSNLRFNTVTKTLDLNSTNYGRGEFTVSVPSGVDLGLIHFSTPNNSTVSVTDEKDGIYELTTYEGATVAKIFTEEGIPNSGTKTFWVVYNGDPNGVSTHLNISIALAKQGSIPTSDKSITLTYNCVESNLYEYEVGVHAYSAYDAKAGSSTLTTKLYSATPITSWSTSSTGTSVYSSPYFHNPALPYFYGFNGKVYRVGEHWSRSFGLKFRYEIRVTWHWFFKRRTNSKRVTLGPLESLNSGTNGNQPTSEACIEPTMRNVGKIRQIIAVDSAIIQPLQYRYYMGYDASNQRNSNDSVFTHYSLAQKKHIPITGLMHVLAKHTRGIINGFKRAWDGDVNWTAIAGGAGVGLIASLFGESIVTGVAEFFSTIPGPFPSFTAMFGSGAAAALGTILTVLAVLYIIWQLFAFFSPKTHHYKEDCKLFLHHFTSTPYLNVGNSLFRDDDLVIKKNGQYCDGVYYYKQNTSGIYKKELSFTNAFVSETSPQQFLYSLPSDNPTLVTNWQKLILLPYTSGKPIPYCGGSTIYYSAERTHTVTTQCCDLEDCSTPVVITLPYGTTTSCVSQIDADNLAESQFQAAIDYAEDYSVYSNTIDDSFIGQLDVNFTHEIKEETNPTSMALFFDKRNGSDVIVGTKLYYDFSGCTKALPGYYAVPGDSYPINYYKVQNGQVSAIYTQNSAAATSTTTGQSIVKTNEEYSSNWYLKSNLNTPLYSYIAGTNNRTFDVNSLFTTSPYTLSAGRIIMDSYTNNSFRNYETFNSDGISTTSTKEQGTGWYAPINPWKPENGDLFFYQNALTSWAGGIQRFTLDGIGLAQLCDGGNTGNTYYHDGDSATPSIGDKIYTTNNVLDPIIDGYIKYTTTLYMTITNGIMVASTSCSPGDGGTSGTSGGSDEVERGVSGSIQQTSSTIACNSSDNELSYSYIGASSYPAVGDVVYSGWDPSTYPTVNAGWIKFENSGLAYQTNSLGEVISIIDCNNNTLSITSTSTGFPPTNVALIENTSTSNQVLSVTWTYDSQSGDLPATVRNPNGDIVPTGNTSAVIQFIDLDAEFGQNTPALTPPYTYSGGNATTLQFTLLVTDATIDIVPQYPNNEVGISVNLGFE